MRKPRYGHGTPQRYKWELRRDGEPCVDCRYAWTKFHREYRKVRKLNMPKEVAYRLAMKEAGFKVGPAVEREEAARQTRAASEKIGR
jgi:hypothetical protein